MLGRLNDFFSVQLGLDPLRAFRAIGALPSYLRDWLLFKSGYPGKLRFMPCLHDRMEEGGDIYSEYFLQDLSVAKRIFDAKPNKHVDVGSRVDGFVAHVASFRTIEVMDIRPITGEVPGIVFKQADLMNVELFPADYCDSLSCLHALEHFGLGRYGDPIDSDGWRLGLASLSHLLTRGGRLYLSTPIGKELVMFNAHRVFSPTQLLTEARRVGLHLDRLSWVSTGALNSSLDFKTDLDALAQRDISLGIFEFIKD